MSLFQDVNAGLAAVSNPAADEPLKLDSSNWCGITIPMPPSVIRLADGQLLVEVTMPRTLDSFTFSSALAILKDTPHQKFLEALLMRQFYAEQTSGANFAIAVTGDENVLVAVYHWTLDSITPEQFKALFKQFVSAVFDQIEEIKEMARQESKVKPIHKGRP